MISARVFILVLCAMISNADNLEPSYYVSETGGSEIDVFETFWTDITFSLIASRAIADRRSDGTRSKVKNKTLQTTDCVINTKVFTTKHPLILHPRRKKELLLPKNDGKIYLTKNEELLLSCTANGKLILNGYNVSFGNSIIVQCVYENVFKMAGWPQFSFQDLRCKSDVMYKVRLSETERLSQEYTLFEVGFPIDQENYVPVFAGWTSLIKGTTAYVRSVVPKMSSKYRQRPWISYKLDQTGIYVNYMGNNKKLTIAGMYRDSAQISSLDSQTGCYTKHNNSICEYQGNSGHLYTPGRLIPESSFVYTAESRSTYMYLSTAPQVVDVSRGNWALVEQQVEKLANSLKGARGLDVITGTYGVVNVGTSEDDLTELYLFSTPAFLESSTLISAVPIPNFFWKLAYRNNTVLPYKFKRHGKGIVFVTINEINLKPLDLIDDYYLCENPILNFSNGGPLGEVIDGFNQNLNISRGYTYACTVKEFVNAVKDNLPDSKRLEEIAEDVGDGNLLRIHYTKMFFM